MRVLRSKLSLLSGLVFAFGLAAGSASAVQFGFTGKFTSNRGRIINIPAIGNIPCASGILTVMSGTQMGIPMTMTLAPVPWTRRANTQPTMMTTMGNVTGGRYLLEASREARAKVTESIGVVGFVDGGYVAADTFPGLDDLYLGAGIGVRYYTGLGPLRADIAIPLNKRPGDADYAIYVGIGQAF